MEVDSFEILKKCWNLFLNQPICFIQAKYFYQMETGKSENGLDIDEITLEQNYQKIGKIVALSISDILTRGHIQADEPYQILLDATKKFPKDPEILNAYALAAISKSLFKESEKALLKVLKSNPEFPNTHHNLASLLYRTNRYEEAIKCCNNALRMFPHFHPNIPHFYLSICYRLKGEKSKADFHLKESKKGEKKSVLDEEEEEE